MLFQAGSNASSRLPMSLRLALRELRGGFKGFYIFVACIALGVGAIVAISALADAFESGVSEQGREILGGDMGLSRVHERWRPEERKDFESYGVVSEAVTMRSMARKLDGSSQALVEVKAVDNLYPLVGGFKLKGDEPFKISGPNVAYADPILFERLGLKPGDKFRLGNSEIVLKDAILSEPDRLSSRNAFGPRLLLSIEGLQQSGLIQPGSLVRWRYRIRFDENTSESQLREASKTLKEKYTEKGFFVRDRFNPTPNISAAISRLSKFLTLVGLTALIIGGVGVANAVTTFIEHKRNSIATFKCLGAQNSLIFKTYLLQILVISSLGIVGGIILGLTAPILFSALFSSALPVELNFEPRMETVALGVFYGFLVSLLFVVVPLWRSRDVRPQSLFREAAGQEITRTGWGEYVIAGVLGSFLMAAAVLLSRAELFALYFCIGLAAIFGLFIVYGRFVQWAVQRLPNVKGAAFVVSRANIAGPGSLARTIILSLGLGLSLLVTVSIIDSSLVNQLRSGLPEKAPSHFFLDIRKDQYPEFEKMVKNAAPKAHLSMAPMLRGRIVSLKGVKAADVNAPPSIQWVLRGDRGITYSEVLPENSELAEGDWWSKNHSGENLVSFELEAGKELGLAIGDTIVVNVLGREISAKIANFRKLTWESLSINFVMVFSPNTLAGAPVNMLATLQPENGTAIEGEGAFLQKLSLKFPNVTAIRVKDAIEAFADIYQNIMAAIRAAGLLTLVAGGLVLAGALATAHRRRIYESAIFKTLGARRSQIISAHVMEYLMLSVITGALALLLGAISAWFVLKFVLEVDYSFSLISSLQVVGFSVILVLVFGIIGSWRVLSAKTAPYLRGR